jgi:transcriptional regulator with XRE-family HTH domain
MNLRALRESKHLTQDQVAERGNINQATVSQLELGKICDPRHSTLAALAMVYGVPVQDVVDALNESIDEAEAA